VGKQILHIRIFLVSAKPDPETSDPIIKQFKGISIKILICKNKFI
jgi:hypothetical protein